MFPLTCVLLGLLLATFSIVTVVVFPKLEATSVVVVLFMMTVGLGSSAAKIVEGIRPKRVSRRCVGKVGSSPYTTSHAPATGTGSVGVDAISLPIGA